MNDPDEQARAAYEAYAGALGIDRTDGHKTWDQLPENRRRAWRAVAASQAGTGHTARITAQHAKHMRDWLDDPVGAVAIAGQVSLTATGDGAVLVRTRPPAGAS